MVFGQRLPSNGLDVQLNAVAWGAWIGLLVTMLNLLPVGQLDGGHIAYALLGRQAEWLAYVVMTVCLALGLFIPNNYSWLVWVLLIALMGPRHPAPFNDVLRLRPVHVALGIVGLVLFVLLFMPSPLTQVS
jgi:membrane-associated protease RseP (regulator of RpoE activity)